MTPAFFTAASIFSASGTVLASGFSQNTTLPAFVAVAGRGDIDDVDVFAVDDLVPVGGGFFPAELIGGGLDRIRRSAAEHFHPRRVFGREEPADLTVRVAVRPSHEGIADQRDIQGCHRRAILVLAGGREIRERPTAGCAGTGLSSAN
jgi:hypothetical protein